MSQAIQNSELDIKKNDTDMAAFKLAEEESKAFDQTKYKAIYQLLKNVAKTTTKEQ